jgi:hypothetical protein
MRCNYQGRAFVQNNVNSSVDACISSHIKLEHVITCLFGCTNDKMHVDSFSDAPVPRVLLASPATYRHLTKNADQRRRQQKARATASKAILSNSSPRPLPMYPPNTHSCRRMRPITRSSGLAATYHSASQASTFLHQALSATNLSLFTAAHSANSVIDLVTGASLEYKDLKAGPDSGEWIQSTANEIGRLTQGILLDMTSGTETMFFIPHAAVPAGQNSTRKERK